MTLLGFVDRIAEPGYGRVLLRTSMMRRDRATATGAISVFCLSAAYHAFLLVAAILDRHGRTAQVNFSSTLDKT